MSRSIKMCVDLSLPPWMRLEARRLAIRENPENAGKGAVVNKWAPGRVLKVRFMGGHPTIQAKVQNMAMEWTEHANIGFHFGDHADAEIRIAFVEGDGSWSFLGTDALSIPKDHPTMNYGWLRLNTSDVEYARVVKHEFGHALGLIHEHQHPLANIPWDKEKVYDHYAETQGWSQDEVDQQLFAKYDGVITQFSAYDPKSIMHYPIDNDLTIGDFEVGWNTGLSDSDKTFIRAVYPGITSATELKVGAPAVRGSIAKRGEVDTYQFKAPQQGVYVVETQGATDVVVSVFNASGQLLAEDDDSGAGTNARVVLTLSPGTYTVKVRHYSKTGTGGYTIGVVKST